MVAVLFSGGFPKFLQEFFLQILKAHKIGIIFGEEFLTIEHKIDLDSFFRVVLVLCWVEALFGFDGIFLGALEGPHFFTHIEWLFIGSADVTEHGRLVIRSAKGSFVEDEALVLAQGPFAVEVDLGRIFEETLFSLLFWG